MHFNLHYLFCKFSDENSWTNRLFYRIQRAFVAFFAVWFVGTYYSVYWTVKEEKYEYAIYVGVSFAGTV